MQMTLPTIHAEKIQRSIQILQDNQPKDSPYYGCFSGGKDSCVIKRLTEMAGVHVIWHYNPCPDPPELLHFIRKYHPDVIWTKPKKPLFLALSQHGMPGPWMRLCCSLAKEPHGKGQTKIIGVRAAESPRRARQWNEVQRNAIAPILYWRDEDIWQFINENNIPYCSLYDEGFDRLGCVGCPLSSQSKRDRDFERWPKYERWWKRMCMRLWQNHTDDEAFIHRQAAYGFETWEDHWQAWRGDMRDYLKRHKAERLIDALCGDNDLIRYMQ